MVEEVDGKRVFVVGLIVYSASSPLSEITLGESLTTLRIIPPRKFRTYPYL